MKTKLLYLVLPIFISINFAFAQNSDVTVSVKWGQKAYENKVELYNTANDLLMTLCDDNQCYVSSQQGVTESYGAKYDLGCVTNGNNYYVKLYDVANDGWLDATISVVVAGVEVINNDGSSASTSGDTIYFNVSGGDANCNTLLDTDSDGVVDYLDYDDDADGITDAVENLGQDRFECTLPELVFENGVYDASASTSAEGTVGSVYRFGNAIQGYDVLMEITELTNAAISNIDNDTIDNPTYLQTELTLTNPGTPGATFQFTIVNAGTTTPSTEIFRINGITWDCDGSGSLKESVVYYDAAAYGTENPTSLEITDLGAGDIQISASGLQEGPGFSTLKVLRAYYQFIGNSFSMRMQGIRTSNGSTTRQFGMSFTQCEFLDFNANSLVIITGEDNDSDGKYNHLDLDSDNDGIPDNIEGQTSLGYIAPSLTIDNTTGIDLVYGDGIEVVDTDQDNTPDILDSDTDNDGLLDIEENGMANAITIFSDSDDDGLDLLFEGAVINDPLDVNDDINNPATSILPDVDGDLYTNGDLDYRDLFDVNPPSSAILDFDGIDDYISRSKFIEGENTITVMAWIKSDPSNAGKYPSIFSEGFGCRLYLSGGNKPVFSVRTTASPNNDISLSANVIPYNEWHHVAATFNSTSGEQNLYVDGKLIKTATGTSGGTIQQKSSDLGTFEIGRMSADLVDKHYFKGDIDEVRVFKSVLTENQIQRMVYQEIENNSGNIKGSVINKDIEDETSKAKVAWNNLLAYYPMTDIVNSKTYDLSGNDRNLFLHNITTVVEQTAPMPYESNTNGDWSNQNTWKHGDVWDIENIASNQDWSIVRINSNVTTNNSHKQLGMIVEANKSLTVNGTNEVNNTWYLELNGTLDLEDDSQLIQGIESDLVTSANGKILRRQEGTSNMYWYTYMSSPVGETAQVSLINDNGSSNNPNNTDFDLDMLKEGNGDGVKFTSAYHEVGKISTYWTYSFLNGITYWDWTSLSPSTSIEPGVGYIHKGTGNPGLEQQYIFEGKPNNGTIKVVADDVDGDSGNESQPDVTQTTTLIGNPYPSAIDAHQFIDDNVGVIDGTLYFWHQWSGASHILQEYQGGYAVVNKLAKIRAYQFVGFSGANTGSQDGIITPTQYIPVGQSFMTEVIADGEIEFNNGQRIFKQEDLGESEYFRNSEKNSEEDSLDNTIQVINLEFKTSDGLSRELAVGFSDFTSSEFDYGYDGKMFDDKSDDMYTVLNGEKMITQAYSKITMESRVPLVIAASGIHKYYISAKDFSGFDKGTETSVYLKDNYRNVTFDLTSGKEYSFGSESGEFTDRFEIIFKTNSTHKTLKSEEILVEEAIHILYSNKSDKLFVKGLDTDNNNLIILNTTGQKVGDYSNLTATSLNNGIQLSNLSSGVYIVSINTISNTRLDKKIIIN